MAHEEELKISLKTADGIVFKVESTVTKEFQTIQSFIDVDTITPSTIIPLPNVYSRELDKIIDYCRQHCHFRKTEAAVDAAKDFDAEFVKALSHEELKELILAANYLNAKDLLDFLIQSVANLIENKSVNFVRNFFGIVNDFTPEEEAKLREENAWAFQGIDDD